jgi:hypothetical protein
MKFRSAPKIKSKLVLIRLHSPLPLVKSKLAMMFRRIAPALTPARLLCDLGGEDLASLHRAETSATVFTFNPAGACALTGVLISFLVRVPLHSELNQPIDKLRIP